MLSIPDQEYTFLCGDLNGHIRGWHQELTCKIGSYCFGFQNSEGHRHFNFRQSQNLAALNTFFNKRCEDDCCTFKNGDNSTQIDFILTRLSQRSCVNKFEGGQGQ